ncbi:hypothetical protein F5Y07DRAFT_392767 [Xylaria sp. FL0933]|nr:hypothetical protein F5Y07DRAFT_392767 [Xylaria sp. FL0933]
MLSTICKDGDKIPRDLLRKYNIDSKPDSAVTPSDYFISNDGEAIPYEFVLGGLLGLSVRDNSVPPRLNMLYYKEPPEEEKAALLTTTWRIGKVNGIIEAKQCSHCNDLRYHHKNCTSPTH